MTPKEAVDEIETYTITPVGKNGDAPTNLEEFFIRKLGSSTGKKLYKELVAAAKDCPRSCSGALAINLDTRRGAFVVLTATN